MECLSSGHINTICQRCNNESRSVTKILIVIKEASVCDLDASLIISPIELELWLPLELLSLSHMFIDETNDDVTWVGIDCNETHNFLTHWLWEITLHKTNQVREKSDGFIEVILHRINVTSLKLQKAFFDLLWPNNIVDQQSNLSRVLLEPLFATHWGKVLEGSVCNLLKGSSHSINDFFQVTFNLSVE